MGSVFLRVVLLIAITTSDLKPLTCSSGSQISDSTPSDNTELRSGIAISVFDVSDSKSDSAELSVQDQRRSSSACSTEFEAQSSAKSGHVGLGSAYSVVAGIHDSIMSGITKHIPIAADSTALDDICSAGSLERTPSNRKDSVILEAGPMLTNIDSSILDIANNRMVDSEPSDSQGLRSVTCSLMTNIPVSEISENICNTKLATTDFKTSDISDFAQPADLTELDKTSSRKSVIRTGSTMLAIAGSVLADTTNLAFSGISNSTSALSLVAGSAISGITNSASALSLLSDTMTSTSASLIQDVTGSEMSAYQALESTENSDCTTKGLPASTVSQPNFPWQVVFPYNNLHAEFPHRDICSRELEQHLPVPEFLGDLIPNLAIDLSRLVQQLLPNETDLSAELSSLDFEVHKLTISLSKLCEHFPAASLITDVLQEEEEDGVGVEEEAMEEEQQKDRERKNNAKDKLENEIEKEEIKAEEKEDQQQEKKKQKEKMQKQNERQKGKEGEQWKDKKAEEKEKLEVMERDEIKDDEKNEQEERENQDEKNEQEKRENQEKKKKKQEEKIEQHERAEKEEEEKEEKDDDENDNNKAEQEQVMVRDEEKMREEELEKDDDEVKRKEEKKQAEARKLEGIREGKNEKKHEEEIEERKEHQKDIIYKDEENAVYPIATNVAVGHTIDEEKKEDNLQMQNRTRAEITDFLTKMHWCKDQTSSKLQAYADAHAELKLAFDEIRQLLSELPLRILLCKDMKPLEDLIVDIYQKIQLHGKVTTTTIMELDLLDYKCWLLMQDLAHIIKPTNLIDASDLTPLTQLNHSNVIKFQKAKDGNDDMPPAFPTLRGHSIFRPSFSFWALLKACKMQPSQHLQITFILLIQAIQQIKGPSPGELRHFRNFVKKFLIHFDLTSLSSTLFGQKECITLLGYCLRIDDCRLAFVIKMILQRFAELIANDKSPPSAFVSVLSKLQTCDPEVDTGQCLLQDMIHRQSKDFWTSKNEFGFDALMLMVNSDIPLVWIEMVLNSGKCNILGVSRVDNKYIQFILQHVNGIQKSVNKTANTVISNTEPIAVKRILKKNLSSSEYETMQCHEGQEAYASKDNVRLRHTEDTTVFSKIMVTGTVKKSAEYKKKTDSKQVVTPQHFNSTVNSDGESFTTLKYRYKFDPDAKTIDLELSSVDVPENYSFKTNALLIACKRKRWDAVLLLVEKGANVNHRDADGSYPLGLAIKAGEVKVAEAMIPRMGFRQLKKIEDKEMQRNHLKMAKYYGLESVVQLIREAKNSSKC
ncbi:unnamed protein product [Sphagnum tenellum]